MNPFLVDTKKMRIFFCLTIYFFFHFEHNIISSWRIRKVNYITIVTFESMSQDTSLIQWLNKGNDSTFSTFNATA